MSRQRSIGNRPHEPRGWQAVAISLYGDQAKFVNGLVRDVNAKLRANILNRSMVIQAGIELLRRAPILDEEPEKIAMWLMLNRRDTRSEKA